MAIAFNEYLEAKYALDNRSFNSAVNGAFLSALEHHTQLSCLDVGTGTGAMLGRVIDANPQLSLTLTGLDCQSDLLTMACAKVKRQLENQNFSVCFDGKDIFGKGLDREIRVSFECGYLDEFFRSISNQAFDLITAHAVIDLLPLPTTLENFATRLKDGGLVYSTINYDGDTSLLPVYADPTFERQLLDNYNASMEKRRISGELTGGAYAGRRLHTALTQTGFKIIAVGSSDWNITPIDGRYRDQDDICLVALLDMIRGENADCTSVDASALSDWYQHRLYQLEQGQLGMIVHQLDILARKNKSPPQSR